MSAVVAWCSVIVERISAVVRRGEFDDDGEMVIIEVDGLRP